VPAPAQPEPTRSRRLRRLSLAAAFVLALVLGLRIVVPAPRLTGAGSSFCDLYASPLGSDGSGNGSLQAPFASLQKLDQALSPGQTGCLRAGSYGGLEAWHRIDTNGAPGARIRISSYPGEVATIVGYVDIEAAYTTLENVRIDGSNTLYPSHPAGIACYTTHMSMPLVIAGQNDILQFVDYYQSVAALRGNGIGVGFWGDADNTIIRYDKIHDVGSCLAYDHLIYLSHGNNVQIYDNWMWNDPHGRGVQLYPAPTNVRVFGNVIDHAGEGFALGDETGSTVSGNKIYKNIVTNSTGLPSEGFPGEGIHDYYGGQPGTNNSFFTNDVYANPGGIGRLTGAVTSWGNTTTNPQFINSPNHDYQLQSTSNDTSWHTWSGNLTISRVLAPAQLYARSPASPGPARAAPTGAGRLHR
jgi:Right handed beta helix region